MITTLFIATAMGQTQASPVNCPVQGEPAVAGSNAVDYNGARYKFCCPGCDVRFERNPQMFVMDKKMAEKTLGEYLFDPISGKRIIRDKAVGSADYRGVRFYFYSQANKETFVADPAKFGKIPDKEALYCPVMAVKLNNYYGSAGFVDVNGTRVFTCCDNCFASLRRNAAPYAQAIEKNTAKPRTFKVSAALVKATGM